MLYYVTKQAVKMNGFATKQYRWTAPLKGLHNNYFECILQNEIDTYWIPYRVIMSHETSWPITKFTA